MAIVAALIMGGAAVAGSAASYAGQQSANVTSEDIASQTNATQIELANTAIQRRVADYKAAGLNPVLAAGGPGAGGISPVMPNVQNPMSAAPSGAVGIANALSTAAQIKNTEAQTRLTQAQTPGDVVALKDDGSPDFTRATGGLLGNLSAGQMAQSIKNAEATYDQIQASIKQTGAQTSLTDVQTAIAGLSRGQLQATLQALIAQQLAETKVSEAKVPEAEASARLMQGNAGVWIKGVQTALGIANAGVGLAGGIGRLGTQTIEKSMIGPQGQYRGGSVTTQ